MPPVSLDSLIFSG